MSTSTQDIIIEGLKVKEVNEKKRISWPRVITNDLIPSNRSEIAIPNIVRAHPHISNFAPKFKELEAQVLVLISLDAGKCMFTKCYGYKPPFVHHTSLGWALVGSTCKSLANNEYCLKTCTAKHFSALSCFKQDVACLKSNKWSLPDYNVFEEKHDDELLALSKNDDKFHATVFDVLHTNNEGNIAMPIPFKDSNVTLQHDRSEMYRRTKSTLVCIAK